MTVDWNMAAVAAALSVFAAPIAWEAAVRIVCTVQKMRCSVVRLKWDDIPAGRLHDCDSNFCRHPSPHHTAQKRCWESEQGLATVYNRAWELSKRRPQFAKHIPGDLPSSNSYICTDARTVLAFELLTTTNTRQNFGTSNSITVDTWKGITFCHVRGSFHEPRTNLTKHEVERMLEGYPPWYRDTFVTKGSIHLPFPISGLCDVSRGGWIVAVGLIDRSIESQEPLELYRCQDEPKEPEWRSNGVVYRKAIERCCVHITRNIQPHFPHDANVKFAVTCLEYLLREKTDSGAPCGPRFGARDGRPIPHLRSSDCRFLMKNFNNFQALDVESGEERKFGDVLLPAMAAVVDGAIEVVQYLKNVGVAFKFPEELADFEQEVYLKDCVSRLSFD